eukprot:s20_g14.t2
MYCLGRTVQLLTPEPEENAGTATCRFCIRQRGVCLGLVLLVAADVAASVVLASAGRQEVLFLCIFRGVLLAFGFTVAVKMGLGVWSCACCNSQTASAREERPSYHDGLNMNVGGCRDRPQTINDPNDPAVSVSGSFTSAVATLAELERQRAAVATREAHSWKRNLVLAICFVGLGISVQSVYAGIQVLTWADETPVDAICFTLVVACMNAEAGREIAHCKVCRERIGQRTGGHEGFKCRECDSSAGGRGPMGTGGTFWVCLQCYRKHQNTNAQDGILRGDKGPKYVPELTSWEYFKRALNLCKPFQTVLQCAVICTIITQVIRVLLPRYQGDIINSLIDQDREVMFESLIKQDIAFFDGTMTGQLTSRMTNDVAAVVQPVRQILNTFLTSILRLIGGLFMCLFTSWKLTVLAATMIGPVVYLTGVYAKWSKKLNMAIRVNMADANAVSTEALRNIRTVRSFGADSLEVAAFRGHMDQALHGGMKDAYASAGVSAITQYLDFAATILILWYGGFAVLGSGQHGLSIGHLITFNLYWNMLNTSITSLNGMLNTLVKAASAAQRVFEVIDLEPDIPDAEGDDLVRGRPCSINFQAVRFIYPMRPENVVLHACSFSIGAGQTVAVVGRSGAGKSTLVGLLLRFYDPRGGQILVNGRPLTEYNLQLYRKLRAWIVDVWEFGSHLMRVGVVSQDTQVFCRSILENLTYGLEPGEVPPTEDIVAASKAANAHAFVEARLSGFDATSFAVHLVATGIREDALRMFEVSQCLPNRGDPAIFRGKVFRYAMPVTESTKLLCVWRTSGEEAARIPVSHLGHVDELKQLLHSLLGVPRFRQAIVHGDVILDDHARLSAMSDVQLVVLPVSNASPEDARTFLCAAMWGWEWKVEEMVRACHDPNLAADFAGELLTPIQAASKEGHREMVSLLLEAGAQDVSDAGNQVALAAASMAGHSDVVTLLLEAGGDRGRALEFASRAGKVSVVRMLLQSGAEGLTTCCLRETLVVASSNNDEEIVSILLEAGALDIVDWGWPKAVAASLLCAYASVDRSTVIVYMALPLVVVLRQTPHTSPAILLLLQLLILLMLPRKILRARTSSSSLAAIVCQLLVPLTILFRGTLLQFPMLVFMIVLLLFPTKIVRLLVASSTAAAARLCRRQRGAADLEDGYHSMIGEGGTRLSGGQRQRDAENEGKVQEALDELVHRVEGNCSVMLIAHRLSTVMSSDKIVVMDKGIVELLKNQNIYAGLVQRQLAKQANTVSEAAEEEASASEVEPSRGKGWKGKMAELDAEGLKGKGKGKRKGKNGRGDAAEGHSLDLCRVQRSRCKVTESQALKQARETATLSSPKLQAQWPVGLTSELTNCGNRLQTHAAVLHELRRLLRSHDSIFTSNKPDTLGRG